MALALLAVTGCKSTHHVSGRGGVVPLDEGFSITVPRSSTVQQGGETTVPIVLNRGADFKSISFFGVTSSFLTFGFVSGSLGS
jgi:hypothetical protein